MEERNDQTSCQKLARPRPTAEDTLLRTPSSPPCSSRLSREVTLPTSGPGASARVRNSEAGSVLAPAGLISDCLCVWWQLRRVVSCSTVANYHYHIQIPRVCGDQLLDPRRHLGQQHAGHLAQRGALASSLAHRDVLQARVVHHAELYSESRFTLN